ncbi:MAG TPA: thiolase family protein [Solirubrobacteraceae bacterium]|jgi:acetyl-CoA acetyltransferase family protein|nr:thiolase family protein [Solirubrobacteraceae bacterium]
MLTGREPLIVEAVRTPIGRAHPEKGAFRDTHPNLLLGACLTELIQRTGIDPAAVEDVIAGCTAPFGEQSRNIARNSWLQAGYPVQVPAITIDRRCGSAQSAVAYGAALIASGTHDLVIAAGVEHMHHVPINSPLKLIELFGDPWPQELLDRFQFIPQGLSAELIAERWSISRGEMDELAVQSHARAARAQREGRFDREIVALETPHGGVTADQGVRPGTTLQKLAELPPAFKKEGGRITAGSSSQLSDGAAAVLLASPEGASRLGLRGRARIVDQVSVGVDPIMMLTGPIPATRKLLERGGTTIGDYDLFECNEAFASVVLAWQRELEPDMDKVNVNGGAMALGHPVGSTGARLITSALHELERSDGELALVTMCCGGGLGTGTVLQRL